MQNSEEKNSPKHFSKMTTIKNGCGLFYRLMEGIFIEIAPSYRIIKIEAK